MEIARTESVRNAAVTRLVRSEPDGPWQLTVFNDDRHLQELDVPTTEHPGAPGAVPR
jgi:hypothetical protein